MFIKRSTFLISVFKLFIALLMSVQCVGIAVAGGNKEASPDSEDNLSHPPVTTEEFDLSKLDFSEAILSIAGPRHLYIRHATYDSRDVSFILESENFADPEREWKVKEIFNEDISHIPDNIYVDFANITGSSENIEFSGFIIDGVAYTAEMTIVDPKTLQSFGYQEDEFSQRYKTSVAPLQEALEQLVISMPTTVEPVNVDSIFTKTLHTGFSSGITQIGRWDISDGEITQKDASEYFAKLIIPVEQSIKPTLFSFKARSLGTQWTGLGLHFFATDTDRRKGYAYGDSLLFWLTRDPKHYGTSDTHVQLYKSDDAIQMGMVLDAIIEEPISEYMQVDIIFNPVDDYFTVFINGIGKLKYKTWFALDSGFDIVFRTLKGGCSFKDLVVKTME